MAKNKKQNPKIILIFLNKKDKQIMATPINKKPQTNICGILKIDCRRMPIINDKPK
jgi:hypothetical protein